MEHQETVGQLIRRLHQISASVFHARVRAERLDLTPVQFAAMSAMARGPGQDQATLAGRIAHDRATIGGVIDRLEGKGLVARSVSRRDRRARELRLTEEGERLLARLEPLVRDLQDEILCGLDAGERQTFLRLAAKAAEAANHRSRAPLADPD